jgi:ferritin
MDADSLGPCYQGFFNWSRMDQTLAQALNNQFTFERYSADVYYALATRLDYLNLTGFSAYMHKRAGEEREHARKFADYLADRDVLPVIDALDKPPVGALTVEIMGAGAACFQMAIEHEYKVTDKINMLYDLAEEVGDPPTKVFLHWFITEQVEEVRSLEEIKTKFALAAGNGAAILQLNDELGG